MARVVPGPPGSGLDEFSNDMNELTTTERRDDRREVAKRKSGDFNISMYLPLAFALVAIAINQIATDDCVDFSHGDTRRFTVLFLFFLARKHT